MPPIEGDSVSGQKPTHKRGQRDLAGLQEKMEMAGHKSPGQTGGFRFFEDSSKPFKEIIPVRVIPKDFGSLDPPANDVVQGPRCVNS